MKKIKTSKLWLAVIVFALAVFAAILLSRGSTSAASAYVGETVAYPPYASRITEFNSEWKVNEDRMANVREEISFSYYGNRGFIRDIPVNGGETVRNIKVSYLNPNGSTTPVEYEVYSEDYSFISISVDDDVVKYEEYTYLLTYDYLLTVAKGEGENELNINALGLGIPVDVDQFNVKLILPDGYAEGKCFAGMDGDDSEYPFTIENIDGNTIISASFYNLSAGEGVTFYLNFESGSFKTFSDFTPYWFAIACLIVLLATLTVKFLAFNKTKITPVVNYEAPDDMDPLIMGKLIDNKVNSADVTSMIFYWADKGYIKIDLSDKDDPTLIRITQTLPPDTPAYEVRLYEDMFRSGDAIKPSELKYIFYKTVGKVTSMVNEKAKGLYDSKSIGFSIIFAVLAGLLPGLAPLILGITQISSTYILFAPFIIILPLLLVYALAESITYNNLKLSNGKNLLLFLGLTALWVLVTLFYALLVPDYVMPVAAQVIIGLASCVAVSSSVLIISRTQSYAANLNMIVGFRNFILYTEKDRLEKMIEENPAFYYHILPYAQVLGVTDKWEEKFEDITVEPPNWCEGSTLSTVLEFHMINSIIRNSCGKMAADFVSRPSSSGGSGHGGFGGGFSGGGHVGGGHGGGGMRLR